MPFPRKLLNEGEDVVLDLNPHWWFFSGPVIAVVVTTLAAVALRDVSDVLLVALVAASLVCLLWVAARYARWTTTNFVVTTDRLVFRHGVLSKRGKEIPLHRVNDIAVDQSLFERSSVPATSPSSRVVSAASRSSRTCPDPSPCRT